MTFTYPPPPPPLPPSAPVMPSRRPHGAVRRRSSLNMFGSGCSPPSSRNITPSGRNNISSNKSRRCLYDGTTTLTRSVSSPAALLRFNPQVRVRYVPSLDDLEDEDTSLPQDLWYSSEEYKYIRRRERSLLQAISRQAQNPSLAQRVLSLQTAAEREARFERIRLTQLQVLQAQERGAPPDRLAQVYSKISLKCTEQARERGFNVEIVLRNLEHCSMETATVTTVPVINSQRGRRSYSPPCDRWAADSTSSSSSSSPSSSACSSVSPTRWNSRSHTTNNNSNLPCSPPRFPTTMATMDVPVHLAMRRRSHHHERHADADGHARRQGGEEDISSVVVVERNEHTAFLKSPTTNTDDTNTTAVWSPTSVAVVHLND